MNERLKQQLDFILEIDKEKNILRQTHLSGHGRRENDAEHAWHMAIMAYMLKDYANEPVDIAKVMIMCLIHDIVEIDAGDTYAYDTEGLKTQKAREDAAKERIFSLLPEDQKKELTALFDEFENYQTPESKFAHSLDNLQPLLLNNSNGGGDWREHQVTSEQVYGRQRKTQLGSETLYKVTDQILKENIEKGKITSQLIPPKSRHGYRTIPIPEFIKVELLLTKSKYEELKETNAKFDYTPNFVFVNSIGHPISRDKKISNLFKEIILACDLDPDKYHWHDLRHTYATLLEINDINLKKIMQVMGHGHVDMTKSVYINTEEVVYDQTAVMEKWIEKLCTPEGSVDLNTFDPNHIPNKFNWWRESKWTQK